ncbi:MAG: hypothetical protein GY928_36140 [Colwellia sp.]|nr:hypothetical protein [Colwellia sp.]
MINKNELTEGQYKYKPYKCTKGWLLITIERRVDEWWLRFYLGEYLELLKHVPKTAIIELVATLKEGSPVVVIRNEWHHHVGYVVGEPPYTYDSPISVKVFRPNGESKVITIAATDVIIMTPNWGKPASYSLVAKDDVTIPPIIDKVVPIFIDSANNFENGFVGYQVGSALGMQGIVKTRSFSRHSKRWFDFVSPTSGVYDYSGIIESYEPPKLVL